MKKLLVLISISCFNFASAENLPVVKCELMYSKTHPNGTSDKFARGENNLVTIDGMKDENNGFEIKGSLSPICAADGGPCNGYSLQVSIKKDESSNYLSYRIGKKTYDRVSTSLAVGRESGFANCDIEQD